MTQGNTDGRALAGVLEDITAARGLTVAEAAEQARRNGYAYTPADIAGASGGFGSALDSALGLEEPEVGRVVAAMVEDLNARRFGLGFAGDVGGPRAPGLSRYPGENPRGDGGPRCSVSHPDAGGPCGEPATMEVWSLPFCEVHGAEAKAAALNEMWEEAYDDASRALEAARPRWRRNGALLSVLRAAQDDAQRSMEEHSSSHEEAAVAAYGGADDANTHRTTLAYDGDDFADAPPQWWGEERRAVLKAMREAHEGGLPTLVDALEPIRERATVQEILAIRREISRSTA